MTAQDILVIELQKQIKAQGSESWIEIQKTCSRQHARLCGQERHIQQLTAREAEFMEGSGI